MALPKARKPADCIPPESTKHSAQMSKVYQREHSRTDILSDRRKENSGYLSLQL